MRCRHRKKGFAGKKKSRVSLPRPALSQYHRTYMGGTDLKQGDGVPFLLMRAVRDGGEGSGQMERIERDELR